MRPAIAIALFAAGGMLAQSFEVATIKLAPPDFKGRYFRMQGAEFVARNFTLKTLLAGAYNLTPRCISGGPTWVDSDHYDILAKPPGDVRPDIDQQMAMLRTLVSERFKLRFHREAREMPIYALTIARNGPKLKAAKPSAELPQHLAIVISPDGVSLPGRNTTLAQVAGVMQRAALDRPVIDETGLTGRYDFDLSWTPDETQFGGMAPRETDKSTEPDLFTAIQQQLGLRLEATKGPVQTLVIDQAERPSEN